MTRRQSIVLAAVALVVTAVGGSWAGAGLAGAAAATSCASSGVTVVVDFHDLGGGVRASCVADGAGQVASKLFPEAGFPLTYAQRQPGFVCRVSGVPTSDPCVTTAPADAYWGLWSSTGDAGAHWTYASAGAGSLKVPAGGLVAFSWDDQSGDDPPRASASRPASASSPSATATPTSRPTRRPTTEPTTGHSSSGAPQSPAPSDSASATDTGTPTSTPVLPGASDGIPPLTSLGPRTPRPVVPTDGPSSTPTGSPSASGAATPTPISPSGTSAPADSQPVGAASEGSDSGSSSSWVSVPWWVVVLVLLVLAGGAAAAVVARRRRV